MKISFSKYKLSNSLINFKISLQSMLKIKTPKFHSNSSFSQNSKNYIILFPKTLPKLTSVLLPVTAVAICSSFSNFFATLCLYQKNIKFALKPYYSLLVLFFLSAAINRSTRWDYRSDYVSEENGQNVYLCDQLIPVWLWIKTV